MTEAKMAKMIKWAFELMFTLPAVAIIFIYFDWKLVIVIGLLDLAHYSRWHLKEGSSQKGAE